MLYFYVQTGKIISMEYKKKVNKAGKNIEAGMDFNSTMPIPNERKMSKKRPILRTFLAICLALLFFVAGALVFWFSLDSEMRSLIKVKNMIDKEYYQEIEDERFYGALFSTINDTILDPYSHYMTTDEVTATNSDMAGERSGIGIVFSTQAEDGSAQLFVIRVCGNSPAEGAGIRAGEFVVAFGKTEKEMKDSVVFDELSAFLSTCQTGEPFYIKVRAGDEVRNVALSKAEYVESHVFYRSATTAYGFTGKNATEKTAIGDPLSCLDKDTAYIRLRQFAGEAVKEFEGAMEIFKSEGKKNLVLDLRDNGGGYLDVMQEISGFFCKNTTGKPVVAIADYGEKKEEFRAKRNVYSDYFQADSRICVLANGNTASASESLMGCMIDYGATTYADICLTEWNGIAKTFGKGIMQSTYYLGLKKDALKLTTAEIQWPSGKSIHARGVLSTDGTKTVKGEVEDETELINAIKTLF